METIADFLFHPSVIVTGVVFVTVIALATAAVLLIEHLPYYAGRAWRWVRERVRGFFAAVRASRVGREALSR